MSKVRVKINKSALREVEQEIAKHLGTMQAEINTEIQTVVREVRDEMTGQPADAVYSTLVTRMQERIPGITPRPELREVAQAISDGELAD